MSMNYRFPTLDVDDLRSPTFDNEAEFSFRNTRRENDDFGQESGIATNEQSNDSRQLYALLAESRRLTTENAALRHCLILTKEHSDLKSANYIASAMTWCDDNLRKYTTDLYLGQSRPNKILDSPKTSSAFRPVSPKNRQSKVLSQAINAEEWVKRNTSPTSDLRSQKLVKSKPATTRASPPRSASQPPWHMSLRKYNTPSSIPRPKSAFKEKSKYSPSQSVGSMNKKSPRSKRSSIPIPIAVTPETMTYQPLPPGRWSTSPPSGGEETTISPKRALFTDEDSYRSRTPTPYPARQQTPIPIERQSPAQIGRQSPAPIGRQSPAPILRQSPSPIRTPSAVPRTPTPSPKIPLPSRGIPSPAGRPVPTIPAGLPPSPKVTFGSPREPVRSPVKFDQPSYNTIEDMQTPIARHSISPQRPPTPARSASPYSMLSGEFSPSRNQSRSPSPVATAGSRSRSSSPVPPGTAGQICQGSPRTLPMDPLIKVPTHSPQVSFRSNVTDYGHLSEDITESTNDYLSTEDYASRSSHTAPPSHSRQYELIGQPVAMSTPVSRHRKPATSPRASNRTGRTDPRQQDSLAQLMGINGEGAGEKARGVLYRAVDTLTGYRPNLTSEAKYHLITTKQNRRIVGEIAFQLDRRILEHVFSLHRKNKKNARYYGYSLTNIMQMIYKEAAKEGYHDGQVELELRARLDNILRKLSPFGYILDIHAEKSQDMVNKYGLLNGPPDPNTVRGFGLDDPAVLRVILSKVIRDENELQDMLIMLDCLCYLSFEDGQPIFMW